MKASLGISTDPSPHHQISTYWKHLRIEVKCSDWFQILLNQSLSRLSPWPHRGSSSPRRIGSASRHRMFRDPFIQPSVPPTNLSEPVWVVEIIGVALLLAEILATEPVQDAVADTFHVCNVQQLKERTLCILFPTRRSSASCWPWCTHIIGYNYWSCCKSRDKGPAKAEELYLCLKWSRKRTIQVSEGVEICSFPTSFNLSCLSSANIARSSATLAIKRRKFVKQTANKNKLMSSFRKECPILLDLPTFSNLSIPLFISETTKSTRTAAVDQQMARQTLAASALLSVVGARRVVHLRSDRAKKRSRWKEQLKLPKKGRNSCQQWDRNTIEFQKFMLFNNDRPKKWIVVSFISLFLTFLALYRVFSLVPKFLILKWSWCCRCSWHSIQM